MAKSSLLGAEKLQGEHELSFRTSRRRFPRTENDDESSIAVSSSKQFVVFLDDISSILYFGEKLPPLWRVTYDQDPLKLATTAMNQFNQMSEMISAYDKNILAELEQVGGSRYAAVASLAYRQVFGAMKVVQNPGNTGAWAFMMEMSTDGDVSTIDVIYPASSQLLYTSPVRILMRVQI